MIGCSQYRHGDKMVVNKHAPFMVVILVVLLLAACQSTYYTVWETLGKEKRHLLRDQIEAVREDQKDASEEFEDALKTLKKVYHFDGGDLEEIYERIKAEEQSRSNRRLRLVDRRQRNAVPDAAFTTTMKLAAIVHKPSTKE